MRSVDEAFEDWLQSANLTERSVLRDAFNAATRKIEELARVRRGKVKAHTRGRRSPS